ncbi:DUF423 domain-containing protein [Hyphomonas sp. FCG-A18]|uniref:DUF423 domain-containing protein n=1 Tax=Hyphomonas sp. FCG-A18 TaxID=3080019 RepID=UPI002B2ED2E9|nr:DUF423 domain-containing protein [Hyphomonas sp. FCG-A18]
MTTLAALAAFLAVALGAFGAHGLEGKVDAKAMSWWQTATFYLLPHAIAAFAIGLSGRSGLIQIGGLVLLLGALLFAATLYAMTLGAPRWFGAITPIGGVAMLTGWALVAFAAMRAS